MPNKILHYDKKLKARAQSLRWHSTLAEVLLWQQIKGRQIHGCDFDRQKPFDKYIVDFYCKRLMLAIEIDGESHQSKAEYDRKRQQRLESLGVRVLRFLDRDVKTNMDGVLWALRRVVAELLDEDG